MNYRGPQRDAVVEWLKPLLTSPSDDWNTLSVDPAVIGYLLRIRKGLGIERREIDSAFHPLCQRYNRLLSPPCIAPTVINKGGGWSGGAKVLGKLPVPDGVGRVVRWSWVNFQYRGVLQFGYSRARAYCAYSRCG